MDALSLDTSFAFRSEQGEVEGLRVFNEPVIESTVPLPPHFGEGTLRTITAREDIGIMEVKHQRSRETVLVETEILKPTIKLGFAVTAAPGCSAWLEGEAQHPVSSGSLCIASPHAVIQFSDVASEVFDFVTLTMTPEFVLESFDLYNPCFKGDFHRIVTEPGSETSLLVSSFDRETREILERLRTVRYHGSVQKLFLEGVTLELAAASLHHFLKFEDQRPSSYPISGRDARRVFEARELLDARLKNPPSLAELAVELGLSVSKLKRDFKQALGQGVHEYVISKRMELAGRCLDEDELTVKEAAYLVGYRSQSHFAEVFKRRFGRLPKDWKEG